MLQVWRIKLCRWQLFWNAVKIIPFISDVQYYVQIKLCKTTGSIHLFKITGILTPDKIKLNKHYIWDILEVDWKGVNVSFKGKVITLPKSVTIKFWDKFKVRLMIESQPLLFHLMLTQGFNCFTLASKDSQKMLKIKSYHYRNGMWNQSCLWLSLWINHNQSTNDHNRHRTGCADGKRHLRLQKRRYHRVHNIWIWSRLPWSTTTSWTEITLIWSRLPRPPLPPWTQFRMIWSKPHSATTTLLNPIQMDME